MDLDFTSLIVFAYVCHYVDLCLLMGIYMEYEFLVLALISISDFMLFLLIS